MYKTSEYQITFNDKNLSRIKYNKSQNHVNKNTKLRHNQLIEAVRDNFEVID